MVNGIKIFYSIWGYLLKNHGIKILLEVKKMNKSESEKFSNAELDQGIKKNSDDLFEYCHVCFIALGSQEKRIYKDENVAHLDCVQK